MRGRILYLLSFVSLLGILLMLNYTTPTMIGVSGVLVFFTMVFTLIYGLFFGLIGLIRRILKDGGKEETGSENKRYMYAAVLSFGPVVLLITRTFDLKIIMLTAIFVFLGCFLVKKRA